MANATKAIYVSANVQALRQFPFIEGNTILANSVAGTTMYMGVDPGRDATVYQKFLADGLTKAFPVAGFTGSVGGGGAVTAANQLLTVATVNGAAKIRLRGDAVPAAATDFVMAAGGGTAGGEADLTLKATTAVAVGDTAILIKEASGTGTILIGDKINLAGDTTDYYATAATATLDGTGVSIAITPPIKVAVASGDSNAKVVTVAAPSKPIALFHTAPANKAVVEVFNLTSAQISTATGGAMTAGREYAIAAGAFAHSAGNVSLVCAG